MITFRKIIAAAAVIAAAADGIGFGTLPLTETSAQEAAETEFEYCILFDGTAEITSYGGEATEIEIPDTLGGAKVTRIGNSAFEFCSSLTEVRIPDSVTNIGINAFRYCISLTEVNIPEGVTSIGNSAFEHTTWLDRERAKNPIVIVNDIVIDARTASGKVNIPEGVTSIGVGAFYYCSSLTEVNIPEGVTSIGDDAFFNCSSLTEVNIPEGVTSIGSYAFYDCSSLTEVNIPEGVTSIGYMPFGGTPWLDRERAKNPIVVVNDIVIDARTVSGKVNISEGVTSIGAGAFVNCSSLTEVNIPDSVTSIGNYAFDNCSSLTEVNIPEGVTSIGNYAFYYCSGLTEVNIPDSVTSIGDGAFDNCSSLTEVNIPKGVISIGNDTFLNCSSLTEINIPEGVTSIGDYAFFSCISLTEVNIPDSVMSIGDGAFVNCSSLTEVRIPEGVTSIGDYAFVDCSSLTEVNIPDSVTSIGDSAFGYYHDSEFKFVTIPGFTIYGYAGSAAEDYAKKNDIIFIEIKDEPVEEPTETPEEGTAQAPSDAAITVDATGELAPKLEMTKEEILSAVSRLFTEEQLTAIRTGAAVLDIILDVTNIDGSISENDKELIAKAVENIPGNDKFKFRVMNYLDIKLGALIGGKRFAVTETDGMITVSVGLEKSANGTYKVVRIHDGRADVIDSQLSKDGARLSFKTDKFSTYAVIYSDVAGGKNAPNMLIAIFMFAGLAAMEVGAAVVIKAFRISKN